MDFFMGPDPYDKGDYDRYKPDSHVIGTRDGDYDTDDFDSFPSKSYLEKQNGKGSNRANPKSSRENVPFSTARSNKKPRHGVRPNTRSISKSSRGRNRSKSP